MTKTYQPIFTKKSYPETSEKWEVIRKFIESWHKIKLPELEITNTIQQIEKDIFLSQLPLSVIEYIKLAKQLSQTKEGFGEYFRDIYTLEKLEEQEAISLMLQGENKQHWAIQEKEKHQEDSAVHIYLLNDECIDEKFEYYTKGFEHITTFVLIQLFYFLLHNTPQSSGFGAMNIPDIDNMRKRLLAEFETHCIFDKTSCFEIFEKENILAFFKKDWYESNPTLYMYVRNENLNFELSDFFINLVKERGGWHYGNIF